MKLPAALLALVTAAAPAFAAAPSTPNPAATPAVAPGSAATPKPDKTDPAKKSVKVSVEMRDGMRFEPPRFEVKPGDDVIVSLENADSTHQPHNFLVLKPGTREEIVKESLELGEKGPAQDFIPTNPAIIAHSVLLNPEGTTSIHFTMPAEKGIYPFVCSMPGHGMIMYGAIYSGLKMPKALSKDPNIPPMAAQVATPGSGTRPYIQRIFMPNSGPASIAVALPGNLNYCWDAGECRLRYTWRGAFIDASAQWRGNGKELAAVPVEPWWSAEKGKPAIKIGAADGAAAKFLGYKIDAGLPEFHYRLGETEVFEKITAAPKDEGLVLHFRIPKCTQPVQLSLAPGNSKLSSSVGAINAGALHLTAVQAADFTVTLTDASEPQKPN